MPYSLDHQRESPGVPPAGWFAFVPAVRIIRCLTLFPWGMMEMQGADFGTPGIGKWE